MTKEIIHFNAQQLQTWNTYSETLKFKEPNPEPKNKIKCHTNISYET